MADYSRRPLHVCLALPVVMVVTATLVVCISWVINAQDTQLDSSSSSETWFNLTEEMERQAIRELHTRLDDDKDGSVDAVESEEFVTGKLHGRPGKSRALHQEDEQISFEELWTSWKKSEVRNWTSANVCDWLVTVVELPELLDQVKRLNIIGRMLPIIATNMGQALHKLELQGAVKRNKLQLRTMDAILFGLPPTPRSYWKDAVAVFSVTLCVFGLALAWRKSQKDSARIDQFLESIHEYENEVNSLKTRLEQSSVDQVDTEEAEEEVEDDAVSNYSEFGTQQSFLSENHELEIEALKRQIAAYECQLTSLKTDRKRLQELLLQSHRQELSHLEGNKKHVEEEMLQAQKVCEKIRKRRVTVFGAFQLANSSSLEEAGLQITKAVNKMHKITETFNEFHYRWRQIEHTCRFTITTNKGQSTVSTYTTSSMTLGMDADVDTISSTATIHTFTCDYPSQKGKTHEDSTSRDPQQQASTATPFQKAPHNSNHIVNRPYPRQSSAPVRENRLSVKKVPLSPASSLPVMFSATQQVKTSASTDMLLEPERDSGTGLNAAEKRLQWMVGGRELHAISEEKNRGSSSLKALRKSQDSLDRQTDSSNESVDGKESSPKVSNGAIKRPPKSRSRTVLKGKNTVI